MTERVTRGYMGSQESYLGLQGIENGFRGCYKG